MSDEPRGPGPSTIERAVAAWQRAQVALAEDPDLAADEAAIRNAIGDDPGAVHPDDLIRRMVRVAAFASTRQTEAKQFIASFRARHERYGKRLAMIRSELFELMSIMKYKNFKAAEATIFIAHGSPAVVITDEAAIPDQYVRMTRTVDRAALREDLKQGVVIEGAYLSNAAPSLGIRGLTPVADVPGESAEPAQEGSE
jgi:hypothetical protein